MSLITGVLYAALIAYLGGWYLGQWQGNFALLLFTLTIVTLLYWLAERYKFQPAREAAARQLTEQDQARRAQLASKGISQVDGNIEEAKAKLLMQPWWLDLTAGLFPVICAVFLMRSFLFEPFKIPSGSMVPTLLVGDLILVNKFHYGVRLPVINKKIIDNHNPERGDVIVFRYPVNPSIDYIKRVVGVPGDEVAYINKRLTINGKPVETLPLAEFYDEDSMRYAEQYSEKLGKVNHRILNDKERPPYIPEPAIEDFPFRDQCRYSGEGVVCKVPPGHFFAMGDNRDNSQDSRFWGFVPDENIVGKAFVVWMNFGNLKRVGVFH
ncbi:MAG TPA: signal peptidase I [Aquabacterium sp.]|uniref:signal peptidase I n=1 Tax=Aquabacterium sp. TaxID=1872578 RepID=UPI002E30289E|nr:signal peptidase I [Aquabacterium sp.]HEX5371433.1 signal peptidase I [Aquabacterium sp.]